MVLLQMFFSFRQWQNFENLSIFDEVKVNEDKVYKNVCQFFGPPGTKLTFWPEILNIYVTPPPMKILLECCIPAQSLSHTSLVIINWLTAGQIED